MVHKRNVGDSYNSPISRAEIDAQSHPGGVTPESSVCEKDAPREQSFGRLPYQEREELQVWDRAAISSSC